ncbi:MAG: DUF2288 domain-containing protein [Cyanobacteria bacterium]|nr:DUF2288 domain-containing protein [Cyanobacteriota bacterium]MDA0867788.1 DUF2288 domain-containing protein [Cyanobacteriota bacterium]
MTQSLRDELANLVGAAQWHNLLPHAAKDTLVVVTPGLALVDVGVAIANDQVTVVNRWISEALIAKPTAEQLEHWDRDRAREFQTLIVQPYVLIQETS